MLQVLFHEFPGRQLRFVLPAQNPLPTQVQLARSATDAVALLNGHLMGNLTADLSLCAIDAATAFPMADSLEQIWNVDQNRKP